MTIYTFVLSNLAQHILGVVLFTYIVLRLFYKVFELTWPELYFSVNDKTALFVSVSWQRYLAFRFAPFFLATTFAAGVFMRSHSVSENISATLLSAAVYSFLTDGKAIYQIITKSSEIRTYFNSRFQVILHIITVLLFLFVGFVSGLVAKTYVVETITPTMQGLVDNLWSSLLVVLLAFYLKQIYSQEGLSEDILFRRSLDNISPSVLHAIDTYSRKKNANLVLVKAVCIAENLQRPKWVRKIEALMGIFKAEGTYGIMQVKSKKNVSDIKSVEIAVSKFFKNTSGVNDIDKLRATILNYNNDDGYVNIVLKIMTFLDYSSVQHRG